MIAIIDRIAPTVIERIAAAGLRGATVNELREGLAAGPQVLRRCLVALVKEGRAREVVGYRGGAQGRPAAVYLVTHRQT